MLAPDAAKAREKFIEEQADEIAKRTGVSKIRAQEVVRKQCDGVLLPNVVLLFDDPKLAGKMVADVLANPKEFEGETLADPLEGAEYGICKAMVMLREDGTVWIHSFAHGRTVYELKLDAAAIRAVMAKSTRDDVVQVMVDLLLRGDVDPTAEEDLVAYAKEMSESTKPAIVARIRLARQQKAAEDRAAEKERRKAGRTDPRPAVQAPSENAPILPAMDTLNSIHRGDRRPRPPSRDIQCDGVAARPVEIPKTHAFTSANEGEDNEL